MLDAILTLEEVERAVLSLKNGKSGGMIDGLTAEHLICGGPIYYPHMAEDSLH